MKLVWTVPKKKESHVLLAGAGCLPMMCDASSTDERVHVIKIQPRKSGRSYTTIKAGRYCAEECCSRSHCAEIAKQRAGWWQLQWSITSFRTEAMNLCSMISEIYSHFVNGTTMLKLEGGNNVY